MGLPIVTIVGNISRIEMKTAGSNTVCKFQIECSEKYKDEWTNLYINTEVWNKQAEFVNQYFKSGDVVVATGKLYTNVYENKEGKKVYETKLQFPNVQFAPKSKNGTGMNSPVETQTISKTVPIDIDEDSLPF